MLDLGRSFLASVERDPHALAIVDSDVRLTYRAWYAKISSLVAAFEISASSLASISSLFYRIAGRPPPFIGRASSPASSLHR
jgi:hypothetical protein